MHKSEVTIARRKRLFEAGRCPLHGDYLRFTRCVEFRDATYFCQEKNCRFFGIDSGPALTLKVAEEFKGLFEVAIADPAVLGISHRKKGNKSRWSRAWLKTLGHCFYCGQGMTLDETTVDHFIPSSVGGSGKPENLVPSCLRCNCAKGNHSIEDYRFALQMRAFEIENEIAFTRAQYHFLLKSGMDIGLPSHRFWFERVGLKGPTCIFHPVKQSTSAEGGGGDGDSI
jgi:hypothetical protein